jgi:hypothetical protein
MAFIMPLPPPAGLAFDRRGSPMHWILILVLLGTLVGAHARAGPDAKPKPQQAGTDFTKLHFGRKVLSHYHTLNLIQNLLKNINDNGQNSLLLWH